MNKLCFCYSLSGNCDLIAERLKEKGYEIRKIEPKKRLPKNFFMSMMVGGYQAAIKYKPKLLDYDKDISKYDEILILSPIWNARIAAPTNTLLKDLNLKDKKVRFIFSSGSGTGKRALKRVNKEYPSAEVLFLQEPKKYPEQLNKIL